MVAISEDIKSAAAQAIDESCNQLKEYSLKRDDFSQIARTNEYAVRQLGIDEKEGLLSSQIYAGIFNRVYELISSGAAVEYVNVYVPEEIFCMNEISTQSVTLDRSDPANWESIYNEMGTYNGYKFLYGEAQARISSPWVEPDNLTSKMNWGTIASQSIKLVVDKIVDEKVDGNASFISGLLSAVFEGYEPALTLRYGTSKDSFLARVTGDLYIREIYIRDKLNRVDGWAYCPRGITERYHASVGVDVTFPVKTNASGTTEYEDALYSYPRTSHSTPGYEESGYSNLRKAVYQKYVGATTSWYEEHIDVDNVVASLIKGTT